MKNKLFISTGLIVAMMLLNVNLATAQTETSTAEETKGPKIEFESKTHNFGAIKEDGGSVTHRFTFTNTGDAPLTITSVRPSCGCTSPKWSRTPVKPGETGTIGATFNPRGRPGSFKKSINVTTNDQANSRVTIFISGIVEKTPPPAEQEAAK